VSDPQIAEIAARWWCRWTHGGGRVERDEQGRLNWRCTKCGRWGDYPVSLKDEWQLIGQTVAEALLAAIEKART